MRKMVLSKELRMKQAAKKKVIYKILINGKDTEANEYRYFGSEWNGAYSRRPTALSMRLSSSALSSSMHN